MLISAGGSFGNEYNQHLNRLIQQSQQQNTGTKAEVIKLEAEKQNLIESIKQGLPIEIIKDELTKVTSKLGVLQLRLEPPKIKEVSSVGIVQRFKSYVNVLESDNLDHDAKVQVRKLISKAILNKDGTVDLELDYSGLLDKKIPAAKGEYLPLVAGACNTRLIHDVINRYVA